MFKIKSDTYDVQSTEIDVKAGEELSFTTREEANVVLESLQAFFPNINWYVVEEATH